MEIESFVGPCEIARADRRVQFGAQFGALMVVTIFGGSLVKKIQNKASAFFY
jgi:hypothetical protein